MSEPSRRISGSAEAGQPRNGYLYRSRSTGLADTTRLVYGRTQVHPG